jgi:ATP-dependent DNA helicase RecG
MMISDILTQSEGKTLEFKRDLSSPKGLLKTLVAFANTAGGKIIIGVDDKTHRPVGIKSPLDVEERLCSLIADSIHPRLVPNIEMVTVDDKTLLIAEVFLSNARPHWLKTEGPENGVYVRLGSSNRQADRELIAELRRSVEGVAFDEMPMPELTVDDLDIAAARKLFKDRRKLDKQELLTLKLLRKDQGKQVPTKGAILLFGKERTFHFPDAWVQCGRFIGQDKTDIFDHIELDEPLPQAVDSILLFLKKHAMRGADFSEIRRKDVWSIPLNILREAVINALVHADYSQRGAPVRIAFFDDRIEIENPGILMPGMTIEDMKQGVSKIRNPVIARIFRELELIEQWGSGVRRMFREAREQRLPEPEIIEIGMRVRFIVRLAESLPVEKTATHAQAQPDQATQQATQQVTQQVTYLLKAISGEMSRTQLMDALALKDRVNFSRNYLEPALTNGLLEMTQPEAPRSPTQKYRLTEKGKTLLAVKDSRHES